MPVWSIFYIYIVLCCAPGYGQLGTVARNGGKMGELRLCVKKRKRKRKRKTKKEGVLGFLPVTVTIRQGTAWNGIGDGISIMASASWHHGLAGHEKKNEKPKNLST